MSETKDTVIQHALKAIGGYEEVYKELHRTPELSGK
jgi:hypothetical protein